LELTRAFNRFAERGEWNFSVSGAVGRIFDIEPIYRYGHQHERLASGENRIDLTILFSAIVRFHKGAPRKPVEKA
jgi:hypothetical protein